MNKVLFYLKKKKKKIIIVIIIANEATELRSEVDPAAEL